MKYEVVIAARQPSYTITVEAASPQLAARYADKRFGISWVVESVNGRQCIGKCDRCERHVFESEHTASSGESLACNACAKVLSRTP